MDNAEGGYVEGPTPIIGSHPPAYIPPQGICWTAPDGSHEWLMPATTKPEDRLRLMYLNSERASGLTRSSERSSDE